MLQLDTALFRYPFRIAVRDYVTLVMDLHNADHFFHAFTYPGWKHIVSFGQRGEAPDEMLSADNFHFISLDTIWGLDSNKMEITRWRIDTISHHAECVERIPLDKKLVRVLDFFPMDSGFFVADYMGESRYHTIDKTGKFQSSHGEIPTGTKYKDAARPALAQAWRSFMDYNPVNKTLALVTQLGEVLEIHSPDQDSPVIVYGPEGEPQFRISRGEGIPSGIMGFSDVQVTDNYIYTVFHGQSFKDLIASHQKGIEPEDGGRNIYVFDLEGKPVCQYTLDRAIYGIAVDEKTGTIIATDVNNDDPIVRFQM